MRTQNGASMRRTKARPTVAHCCTVPTSPPSRLSVSPVLCFLSQAVAVVSSQRCTLPPSLTPVSPFAAPQRLPFRGHSAASALTLCGRPSLTMGDGPGEGGAGRSREAGMGGTWLLCACVSEPRKAQSIYAPYVSILCSARGTVPISCFTPRWVMCA